jgi:hypothetical protein
MDRHGAELGHRYAAPCDRDGLPRLLDLPDQLGGPLPELPDRNLASGHHGDPQSSLSRSTASVASFSFRRR